MGRGRRATGAVVYHGAVPRLWGILAVSWRQRVVPDVLRGHVNSGYFPFSVGDAALGALGGGRRPRPGDHGAVLVRVRRHGRAHDRGVAALQPRIAGRWCRQLNSGS
ncbi:hypothetical protein GCM10023320_24420 [Pseudonocardia adelaidensis]|uniref:Uncharacterized protein n=1 Tax=Pseudonocardia adelaidensis TaxID=648754 RepID=A0ABP9NIQ5_9PSEU